MNDGVLHNDSEFTKRGGKFRGKDDKIFRLAVKFSSEFLLLNSIE